MSAILRKLRRFWLEQRIEMLRTDIALAGQRRDEAMQAVESLDKFRDDAQRRLNRLKARLTVLERPGTLLAEALRSDR